SVYTSITWLAMMLLYPLLLVTFQLKGVAGELLHLYCFVQVPLSLGLGFIALSNSIYNNLGKPKWSMWLNITRSSIVTYCLCHLGAYYFGVLGAVMASTTSFVIYGLVGVYLALKLYHDRFSLPLLLKPKNQIPTA
ncbi:MAG: hypothetical protein KAG18_01755, partial [Sinobacterium sp.]|nr:hypothetical protein [Sinobacterium sp.]